MKRLEALARKFAELSVNYHVVCPDGVSGAVAHDPHVCELARACVELCRVMADVESPPCPKPVEQEITMRCKFEFVDSVPPSGWQNPRTPPLYCWVLQRVAVEAVLGRSPDMRLISNTQDMVGLTGATFVEVAGHPERLPNQVRENLRIYGWVVITIDDTFARARAAR